uniref:Fibronectin type-III domain-containing protein n=1 Tax=Magallana gigas TaxID=29159 RepID=A0A8W8P2W6_MAGGI
MDDNTTKYSPKDLIDYLFRVSAVNEEGQVSPLETNEPVRLRRKIDVLSSNGGSKVTGYVVKQKRGSDGDWEEVATLKAIETSYKVPKLDEDQEYFFSITALNQNGQGETCELDTSVVPKRPPEKPSPPVGPVILSGIQKTSLVLAWKPSKNDGRSPLTAYYIEMRDPNNGSWSAVTKVTRDISSYCFL